MRNKCNKLAYQNVTKPFFFGAIPCTINAKKSAGLQVAAISKLCSRYPRSATHVRWRRQGPKSTGYWRGIWWLGWVMNIVATSESGCSMSDQRNLLWRSFGPTLLHEFTWKQTRTFRLSLIIALNTSVLAENPSHIQKQMSREVSAQSGKMAAVTSRQHRFPDVTTNMAASHLSRLLVVFVWQLGLLALIHCFKLSR